jgi:nucleotide-binding universal stress UspA family protein
MPDYNTIVVATDFSEPSLAAVKHAGDLASRLGSQLLLTYVVEDRLPDLVLSGSTDSKAAMLEAHQTKAEENLKAYAQDHLSGHTVDVVVTQGAPHECIVELAKAKSADLIVVGMHGHGIVGHILMGSTSERILHHAPCPVLVVPSIKS